LILGVTGTADSGEKMLRGNEAIEATGITINHAGAFQEVATNQGWVIASRAVGKYATGLIEENYSTKGFHNKAKSCNWGPMAGFVLVDPRFTKALDTAGQERDVASAIHHGATRVNLIISLARIRWLMKEGIYLPSQDGPDAFVGFAAKEGLRLMFRLKRVPAVGPDLFSVECRSANRTWVAVEALRDSMATVPQADYRSATTGDYDLFTLWVPKKSFDNKKILGPLSSPDRRMVQHHTLEQNINDGLNDTGEDEHLGNMTPRLHALRNELNAAFMHRGYTGGNMVHHSDETGRPFVKSIDLPVFAVIPNETIPYCLETAADLVTFMKLVMATYQPVLNPGWVKQMLIHEVTTFERSRLRPPQR
jgi:hypothetical protein